MGCRIMPLRGTNLGAARRVSMADLRELLESEGYDDVRNWNTVTKLLALAGG